MCPSKWEKNVEGFFFPSKMGAELNYSLLASK